MTTTTTEQLKTTRPAVASWKRVAPGRSGSDLELDRQIPALLVDHVTKRFGIGRGKEPVLAVDDVSLRLERGEIHGILGANGSGKSTLIRLFCGLLTLDEGRVEVFGHDLERDEMAVKRLINRVSVDAAFFKKLSPMENLSFAARLYGLDAGRARAEALAILERLGIGSKRVGRPIEQMSRMRVDLPEPLAPRIPWISPRSRRIDTSSTALTGLCRRPRVNRFVTWSTSSAGTAAGVSIDGRSGSIDGRADDTTTGRRLFSCGVVVVVTVDSWSAGLGGRNVLPGSENRESRGPAATLSSRGLAALLHARWWA